MTFHVANDSQEMPRLIFSEKNKQKKKTATKTIEFLLQFSISAYHFKG